MFARFTSFLNQSYVQLKKTEGMIIQGLIDVIYPGELLEYYGINDKNYPIVSVVINAISVVVTPVRDVAYRINQPVFGDLYQLVTRPTEFVLKDLYERAQQNPQGVGTAHVLGYPVIKVVRGNADTLTDILKLGSERAPDPTARRKFGLVNQLFDHPTVITMTGREGTEKRAELMHLFTPRARAELYKLAIEKLPNLLESWDYNISLPENMTYIVISILAPAFFGIPEIDRKHVPNIRKMSKLLGKNETSPEFWATKEELQNMHKEVVEKYAKEIYDSKKDLYTGIPDPDPENSDEEKKQQLLETGLAPGIIVESNISGSIGAALSWLSDEQIQKIRAELKEANILGISRPSEGATEEDYINEAKRLNSLPYLESVFKETLRALAPAGAMPRDTSRFFKFKTRVNGKESTHLAFPHSTIIVPIRPIHHDPAFRPNPKAFDPSREFKRENYLPFSNPEPKTQPRQPRECPAGQSGYAAIFFKLVLGKTLMEYDVLLDRRPGPVATATIVSHVEEVHARLIPQGKRLTMRR